MRRIVLLQRNAQWLALAMGLVGVTLFDLREWGLNLTCFVILLLLLLLTARRCATGAWPAAESCLVGLAFGLFSLPFVLRDAASVHAMAWFDLALLAYVLRLRNLCGTWRVPLHIAVLRFLPTVRETLIVPWRGLAQRPGPTYRAVASVLDGVALLRALAISALPIGVFGVLLVSADARFERMVIRLFEFDLSELTTWAAAFLVCAGTTLAVLCRRPVHIGVAEPAAIGLRGLDALVCLLALSALLASYLAVQMSYVTNPGVLPVGETYSGYARRGFFELVSLTALAVPLLCVAIWVSAKSPVRLRRAVVRLAAVVVVLVVLIALTAFHRLTLYTQAYGLTEMRVFAAGVLVTMVFALCWLGPTVLRARGERFLPGVVACVLLVTSMLALLNPHALIARVNLVTTASRLDVTYLLQLSDDALPVLIEHRDVLNTQQRQQLMLRLAVRGAKNTSWRSWNLSRWHITAPSDG